MHKINKEDKIITDRYTIEKYLEQCRDLNNKSEAIVELLNNRSKYKEESLLELCKSAARKEGRTLHHIYPKCRYSEKYLNPSNWIFLTRDQHFQLHFYLMMAYANYQDEEEKSKWIAYTRAAHAFCVRGTKCYDADIVVHNSNEVKIINAMYRKAFSGKNNPMYGKLGKNNPMYGKHYKMSAETKQKISKALSGKNHPMYGKHYKMSAETKQKISKALSGKKYHHSEKYYAKHPDRRPIDKQEDEENL